MAKKILTIVFGIFLFVNIGKGQVGLIVNQEPWQLFDDAENEQKEIVNIRPVVRGFGATESRKFNFNLSPAPQFDSGWFCKLDANMDLKLPYKLRFRLGEYHYTRRLEYGEEY